MLDLFSIITKGGVVLWAKSFSEIRGSVHPIDALIKDVLVEERAGLDHYDKDSYRVQWTFANDFGLIFVVVYQKILQLAYIEELLVTVKEAFVSMYNPIIIEGKAITYDFDFEDPFDLILSELENKETNEKKSKGPRTFQESKKFANTLEGSKVKPAEAETAAVSSVNEISAKLKKLQALKSGKKSPAKPKAEEATTKSKKVLRSWDESGIPQDGGKQLDFSDEKDANATTVREEWVDKESMGTRNADGLYDAAEIEDADSKKSKSAAAAKPSTNSGGFLGFISSLTGGSGPITAEALDPVLAKMKEHLIAKNVAADIAETVVSSVSTSLVGKKKGPFESLAATVGEAVEAALSKILTPRSSTDVLRDVMVARSQGKPYVFTFVGVNGVGKSTNLSKVCFWLLQNKLRVLVAACDTFRAGAVEQLRVHVRNLKALESGSVVDLFEKGYGKDSAAIAKDAINYAKQNMYDVVLVDTAGRMQDNEPLMRALAKLVAVNNPDKIIFVGEALVGNESVDQLTKFNQALRDFSGMADPRQVDGIILSKFDTVDEKVGAALSMTYVTRQPILFVGTGQTYTDLRRMNVKSIVSTLLK